MWFLAKEGPLGTRFPEKEIPSSMGSYLMAIFGTEAVNPAANLIASFGIRILIKLPCTQFGFRVWDLGLCPNYARIVRG